MHQRYGQFRGNDDRAGHGTACGSFTNRFGRLIHRGVDFVTDI